MDCASVPTLTSDAMDSTLASAFMEPAVIPHFPPIFARRRFNPASLPNLWPLHHLSRRTFSKQGIIISRPLEDRVPTTTRIKATPAYNQLISISTDTVKTDKPKIYKRLFDGSRLLVYCTNELGWTENHYKETEVCGFQVL